jgi:hypothetical protein
VWVTRALVVVVLSSCGRAGLVAPLSVRGDAGAFMVTSPDAGARRCDDAPFGVDCCVNGQRVGAARCIDGAQVCEAGDLCTCEGAAQTFNCVDFCGTDAVTGPVCVSGAWQCASGLMKTSECASGTCWGEPGDCCVQPACVDGAWTCASLSC